MVDRQSLAPLPEILSRGDAMPRTWTIEPGGTQRGTASTEFHSGKRTGTMTVPLIGSERARVIRAHEMMHAKISPIWEHSEDAWERTMASEKLAGIPPRAIECIEELRVNHLIGTIGFDVDQLADGSELNGGRELATAGEWQETVLFSCAVMGGKAFSQFNLGVHKVRPEWSVLLTQMRNDVKRFLQAGNNLEFASTHLNDEGCPAGWMMFTEGVWAIVRRYAEFDDPDPETVAAMKKNLRDRGPGSRRAPTAKFAPLVWDKSLKLLEGVQGNLGKGKIASSTGKHIAYPSRMITDPKKRIFSQRARGSGGVILVDQSGSMDLETHHIDALLRKAPGLTIVGYSHRPGSSGTPNVWVIAKGGRRSSSLPSGNIGNGVDGPVLRWGIDQRRAGEPLIWVCDGQVTDSNDHPSEKLTNQCAELVRLNKITMVKTVEDAIKVLRTRSFGNAVKTLPQFGRVGRAMLTRGGR
jgi:hypothetical protein